MENPQGAAYEATTNGTKTQSSEEEEFGEWTQYAPAPPIIAPVAESSSPPPKELIEPKSKPSRRVLACMVFFFISLPYGYLTTFIGLTLYEPNIHRWFKRNYLTVFIAFAATLVLFFVHIFPRVKANPPLNIIFSSLFLTAFAYLTAVLSVIIDTAAPFMLHLVCFAGCWQLMICSLFGVELNSTEGRVTCVLIFLVDFTIVATFLPSKISDKIVAFIVTACVAKVQVSKADALVEKCLQEQDAV